MTTHTPVTHPCDHSLVIVSNYTRVLSVLEDMCGCQGWQCCKLIGSTPSAHRLDIVRSFNDLANPNVFVLLLSSKAGGSGLNIIGANRLIMYDPDWNPANDRQAMARIWREGQPKECVIYRLLAASTIDETIYQRQLRKDGLAAAVANATSGGMGRICGSSQWSREDTRSLFSLRGDAYCATHEMLGRKRCAQQDVKVDEAIRPGLEQMPATPLAPHAVEEDPRTWLHHRGTEGVSDKVLVKAASAMREKTPAEPLSYFRCRCVSISSLHKTPARSRCQKLDGQPSRCGSQDAHSSQPQCLTTRTVREMRGASGASFRRRGFFQGKRRMRASVLRPQTFPARPLCPCRRKAAQSSGERRQCQTTRMCGVPRQSVAFHLQLRYTPETTPL